MSGTIRLGGRYNSGYAMMGDEAEKARTRQEEFVLHVVHAKWCGYPYKGTSSRIPIDHPIMHAEVVIFPGMSTKDLSDAIKGALLSNDYTTIIDTNEAKQITSLWWNTENVHHLDVAEGSSDEEDPHPEPLVDVQGEKAEGRGRSPASKASSSRARSKSPKPKDKKKGAKRSGSSTSTASDGTISADEIEAKSLQKSRDLSTLRATHDARLDAEGDDDPKDKDGCWVLVPLSAILTSPERYARRPGYWETLDAVVDKTMMELKKMKKDKDKAKQAWEARRTQQGMPPEDAPEGKQKGKYRGLKRTETALGDHKFLYKKHLEVRHLERRLRRLRKAQRSSTMWLAFPKKFERMKEIAWITEKKKRKKRRIERKADMLLEMWIGAPVLLLAIWAFTGWFSIGFIVTGTAVYYNWKIRYIPRANPFNSITDQWALEYYSAQDRLRSLLLPDDSPAHGWKLEDREAYYTEVLGFGAVYKRPVWKQPPFWVAVRKTQSWLAIFGVPAAMAYCYLAGWVSDPIGNPISLTLQKFIFAFISLFVESPLRLLYRILYNPALIRAMANAGTSGSASREHILPSLCEALSPGQAINTGFWAENPEVCERFYCSSENTFVRKCVKISFFAGLSSIFFSRLSAAHSRVETIKWGVLVAISLYGIWQAPVSSVPIFSSCNPSRGWVSE